MPTQTTTTKIPAPLFAAAGAGDLAYEQLRKLPSRVAELGPIVTDAVSETNLRADLNKLRKVARRNAFALVSSAATVYEDLVARGERVVRSTSTKKARIEVAPAAGRVRTLIATAPERPARKTVAKRTTATQTATKQTTPKTAAKQTTTQQTTTKRTSAKQVPAKRTSAKRTATTQATASRTPAKRTAAKRTSR